MMYIRRVLGKVCSFWTTFRMARLALTDCSYDVVWLDDDWTVVTEDGSLAAHYENTIVITEDGCEILTLSEIGGNKMAKIRSN